MINVTRLYCGRSSKSDKLRYPERKNNKPVAVFNCTAKCNLRCLHCYSSSDSCRGDSELNTRQARELIDQLADFGCPVILFSGGEPLLRKDIFDLIEHAADLRLSTVLSTNGTLIDNDTARRLSELKISYAGISLDGPKELHDAFRASPGSFRKTMSGISNCRKHGIRTGLRFTMTRQNVKHVSDVFDIAESTGIRRICFYHLIRTGRARNLVDQSLSDEQARAALDTIMERTDSFVNDDLVDEVLTVGNHADGPYILLQMNRQGSSLAGQALQLLLRSGGNRVGNNIAGINWDGRVFPDQFWRSYSLGNVMEKPFGQIWTNEDDPVMKILRNKDDYMDPKCRRCRFFEICEGNFRSMTGRADLKDWQNEPACYLKESEIAKG